MTVKKILAMALLTAGVLAASCSSEDNIADEPLTQQPEENVITLTATLAAKGDNGSGTRVITTGKDTDGKEILNVAWKKDEEIALYYQTSSSSSGYAKATATVTAVDETTHAATITAELDAYPTDGGEVKFVYPASLAGSSTTRDIDETLLLNQNGNLTGDNGISKKFDAATGTGKIVLSGGTSIPTTATVTNTDGTGNVSLQNRVCICKFHFDIVEEYGTGGPIRNFSPITINDGNGHTYTITSDRTDDMFGGPRGFNCTDDIYVAMLPVENKIVTFSTTYGTEYSYTVGPTTLAAGKFYRNLGTIQLVKGGYTNYNYNYELTGSTNSTVMVPPGGTLRLNGASISTTSGPGIQCMGDATIILTGSNSVTASAEGQPAIFISEGKTLTIQGDGSLMAESTGVGAAGIGGGYQGGNSYAGIDCGDIVIQSGTITATGIGAAIGSGDHGTCGAITINGGTVTATGGHGAAGIGTGIRGTCGTITINGGTVTATGGVRAAGIGSGGEGSCGTITIGSGLTRLTATMGYVAGAPIGSGKNGSCGSITIDGATTWSAGTATTHYTWEVSTVKDAANYDVTRWTLTKK